MTDDATLPAARGPGRTVVIIVTILLAGAMIAGAIIYVSGRDDPRVVTTTSAQTAWEYARGGWSCESKLEDGTYGTPLDPSTLQSFAEVENTAGVDEFFDEPVRCTEPRK